jgi:hypothetical protein
MTTKQKAFFSGKCAGGNFIRGMFNCSTDEERKLFAECLVEEYREDYGTDRWQVPGHDPVSLMQANIGYAAGYGTMEDRQTWQRICGAVHPIFGEAEPAAEEALAEAKEATP